MAGSISWKRTGGAIACIPIGLIGLAVPALVLATLLVAMFVTVIVSERVAFLRRVARGEPSPMERLDAPGGDPGGGRLARSWQARRRRVSRRARAFRSRRRPTPVPQVPQGVTSAPWER